MTEMQLKTLQSGQVRDERDRGEAVHHLPAEPAAPEWLPSPTGRTNQILAAASEAPRGAHFVLQLHDELIYEVAREDVIEVAQMCFVGWTRSEGKGPGQRETTSDGLGLRV